MRGGLTTYGSSCECVQARANYAVCVFRLSHAVIIKLRQIRIFVIALDDSVGGNTAADRFADMFQDAGQFLLMSQPILIYKIVVACDSIGIFVTEDMLEQQ